MFKKRKTTKEPIRHVSRNFPEPNQPSCPPIPDIFYVSPNGMTSGTAPPPPPKTQEQIFNEIRQSAFYTLNSCLGNRLLNPDSGAKWFELISHATSETELNTIIETLNAIAAGVAG